MNLSDRPALRNAIQRLRGIGNIPLDAKTEAEFFSGKMLESAYYDKLRSSGSVGAALSRMLLLAESHLRQPDVAAFYDIFRAARYVPLTRILDRDLDIVRIHTTGWEPRFKKLCAAKEMDAFESILFELCVAARYASLPYVKSVKFIPESHTPAPDLEIMVAFGSIFVECKKFDRMSDTTIEIRDAMVDRTKYTIQAFRAANESVSVELTL